MTDTAAGNSWPSIGSEYYTLTLCSALLHAFQQHTRGTKPLREKFIDNQIESVTRELEERAKREKACEHLVERCNAVINGKILGNG